MTTETRTLIELKDIKGIEFECPHCGSKTLYTLEKQFQRLVDGCPNCNEDWFAPKSPVAHPSTPTVAKQVLEGLIGFQKLLTRADIFAHVRLHIADGSK
jgi:uncharacterized protein (DUF983 family)